MAEYIKKGNLDEQTPVIVRIYSISWLIGYDNNKWANITQT